MAQTTKQLAANLDAISAKVQRLTLEMKKLGRNSTEYKTKQKAMNVALKEGRVAADKLAVKMQNLNGKNKNHVGSIQAGTKAQKGWNQQSKLGAAAATKQGNAIARMGKRMRTLGTYLLASAGLTAAIGLVNELLFKSAKRAIALEKALADVGAVAGLTSDELNKLENAAFRVAGMTSLTAVEVVGLQKELAKLGVSPDDIVNLTKPVALLSQALGESGAATASALQKIQNQFRLTSEEATITANELVGAVNNSALTMNDLATGLQYVGPLAKQAGLSFKETASLLGVLADNGFRASRAGTGLRAILTEAAKAGVPFNEFMEELATNGISTADAVELFTKRGAAAAITLSQQYDEVKKLNGELEDQTRLLYANAKQMGSTQGQIDLLKSAYDRASISLGEWITNTEFFIELMEMLDPATAGQARAYKFLSNASETTQKKFDSLTESLVNYNAEAQDQSYGDLQLEMLRRGTSLTDQQIDLLEANFILAKQRGEFSRLDLYLMEQSNEELKDAGLLLHGLVDLASERADAISEERLTAEAMNATYKDVVDVQEDLNRAALQGLMSDQDKQNALDLVNQRIKESVILYNSAGDFNSTRLYSKRIELYERLLEEIENTVNTEIEIEESGHEQKERLDLEYYMIQRDRRLKELADRRAFELAAAESARERNDIEIEYAATVAQVNKEAAAALGQIDAGLYSNEVSILKTIQKWTELGEITGVAAVELYDGFADQLIDQVDDDIKRLGKQLKNGEITVEQYNDAVAKSIEANKSVVADSLLQLVETGKLTQEQADQLNAALENVDIDPKTKYQGKNSLLGRVLGLDMTDIIGDSAEAVTKEQTERIQRAVAEDLGEIYGDFNETKYDNIKNEAEAELDVIKERYRIEEEILKSSLNNQLITESQYRVKQQELKRAQLSEENAVNRKIFESEKEQDRRLAIAEGAEAAAQAIVQAYTTGDPLTGSVRAALTTAAIAGGTALRIGAINGRQFFPKKFEQGGLVEGPSHAEGGVPFTVQGRGGYEMEGGEFIVNKRSASMHRELLERINNSGRTAAETGKQVFANGGTVAAQQAGMSLEYLEQIAAATAGTAINTGKPTRAFVTSKDLNKDSRERSIRERNNRV
jgi:hypothetical protein